MGAPVRKEKPTEELTTAERIVAFVVKEATFLAKNPEKILKTRDGATPNTLREFEDKREMAQVTPHKKILAEKREEAAAIAVMDPDLRKSLRKDGIVGAETLAGLLNENVDGKRFRYKDWVEA
ncbi:Uncharacterised protein [Candidatus Bilamarchaeum dharawalense]|uniref:Uncharacterized protein n=1 Tax=Candidatus Bilamarchaeum dharawalense TaxID=2885759 RepID=A0A5E4LT15_9ARCH|nr:Uncharacterised protein [Candidatus Bilamarchaeum dharawalense]